MAVTCPTLKNYTAEEMCGENLAGLGTTIYFGRKSELSAALTATENSYSTPAFSSNKGLYKMECKDEGQQIQGSSLGPNKGFKLQFDFNVEMVNADTAIIARALNNYQDLFFILVDGDGTSQIMYDPERKCKFESDALKTDTGKAAADDRSFVGSVTLQPVKYPNLYVSAPSDGWDSLLASSGS